MHLPYPAQPHRNLLYRYFVEVRREPDHVAGEPNLWLTFRRIYGDRASLFRAILACISHPNKLPLARHFASGHSRDHKIPDLYLAAGGVWGLVHPSTLWRGGFPLMFRGPRR